MAGMKVQSLGSNLSVNDEWLSDVPVLSRSISRISLSESWSVTSKLRGFGLTKTVKQKPKHGFGGTSVFKVKPMQGLGSVYTVKKGLNNDIVTKELNRRVEEMKLKFQQSRLEIERTADFPTVEPVLRKSMSDPFRDTSPTQSTSHKDSVGTVFKSPMFWSDFLRGIYPNSLPIDKLAEKDEISPEKYDSTRSETELEANRDGELSLDVQSANTASVRYKSDALNTRSIPSDNGGTDERYVNAEDKNDDLSDTSHGEDVWGSLRIPDNTEDMFKTGGITGDSSDGKDMENFQSGDQQNGLETLSHTSGTGSEINNAEMLALPVENRGAGKEEKLADGGHLFLTRTELENTPKGFSDFTDKDGYVFDDEVNSGQDSEIKLGITEGNDSCTEIRDKTGLDLDGDISLRASVDSEDEVRSTTKPDPVADVSFRESGDSDDEVKVRGRSYSFEEFVISKGLLGHSGENWSFRVHDFCNVDGDSDAVNDANSERSLSELSKNDEVSPYRGSGNDVPESPVPHESDSERSEDSIEDDVIFEPVSSSESLGQRTNQRDMYASVHDLTAL